MAETETGICDFCGQQADASVAECNWLSCTFKSCEGGLYHQECLYQFLRSNKLEKNRKTGFKCPRGCGKGTQFSTPCPGRIDKSHPIIPRNEEKVKKRTQMAVADLVKPSKAEKVPEKGMKDTVKTKDGKHAEDPQPPAIGTIKINGKIAVPISPPQPAASTNKTTVKAGKDKPSQPDREQLLAAAMQARKELAAGSGSKARGPSPLHSLGGSMLGGTSRDTGAGRAAAAPAYSAWGSKQHALEPEHPGPSTATLAHVPAFQQLLSAAERRKHAAAPKPGAATPGNAALGPSQPPSTAAAASTPSIDSLEAFPPVSALGGHPPSSKPHPAHLPPTHAQTHAQKLEQQRLHEHQRALAAAAEAARQAELQRQAEVVRQAELRRQAELARQAEEQAAEAARQAELQHAAEQARVAEQQRAAEAARLQEQQRAAAAMDAAGSGPGDDEQSEDHESCAKLTKAQRKNLKRAGKKKGKATEPAHEQAAEAGSEQATHAALQSGAEQAAGSSDQPLQLEAVADAPTSDQDWDMALQDMSVQALVTCKTNGAMYQMLRLGFAPWQALCAVRVHGADVEGGVAWVLDRFQDYPQHVVSEAESLPLPVIDISTELTQLADAHSVLQLEARVVHEAVIKAHGNVPVALAALTNLAGLTAQLNSMLGIAHHGGGGYHAAGMAGYPLSTQPSAADSYYSARSDLLSMASGEVDWSNGPHHHHHRLSLGDAVNNSRSLGGWGVLGSSAQGHGGWPVRGSSQGGGVDASSLGGGVGTTAAPAAGGSRLSGWMSREEPALCSQDNADPAAATRAAWAGDNGHTEHTWESLSSIEGGYLS